MEDFFESKSSASGIISTILNPKSKKENVEEEEEFENKEDFERKKLEEIKEVKSPESKKKSQSSIVITFLGTNSAVPIPERNVSCISIRWPNDRIWLIDCGEGSQHQFSKAKKHAYPRVDKIFITHLHGDHCYGLPGFLAMCSMKGVHQSIEVIGPLGLKKFLEAAFEVSEAYLSYQLTVTELMKDQVYDLGWKDGIHVAAYPLTHRVPCFGYVFQEESKPVFVTEKALKLGVPKVTTLYLFLFFKVLVL